MVQSCSRVNVLLHMLSRKRAVVTVLFTMFSDLGDSLAVQLIFRNFRDFGY